MNNTKEKITIKYKTGRNICKCCDRPLENPEYSRVREFDFYSKNFWEYSSHWNDFTEEELVEVVEEFVYETIDFFAVSHGDTIFLCEGEMTRMHEFAKGLFIKK